MRLSVALTALGVAFAGTSAAAQARTGMINVGDAKLHYELSGRGQTVVFVHGWANTLAIWDDQLPAFNQRYQVLRYDRRGFGKSTGFADVSADPDDLRILLDSLGIASAYVVGLSAGSDVATRFAFAFPRRTLALVRLSGPPPVGMPGAPTRAQENRAALAQIARTHGLDSLHKFVLAQPGFAPPADETEAERQRRLDRQKKGWDYSGRDLLDPKPQSGRVPAVPWERIRDLTVPTLLVNGATDGARQMMVADSLARYLPNVTRVVIPRAGHAANLSQPERFNSALLEFFAGIESSQARSGLMNVGDARLNYEVSGQGQPVVLIHGWALSLATWDDQVPALAPRYRVLRYDLRGYGKSTGHADPSADPDDLRILFDSLGIRSAHVVGLSLGAQAAQNFAVAFPTRVTSLVLYGAGPMPGFPAPPEPSAVELFGELVRKHGMDSLRALFMSSDVVWRPPGRPDVEQWLRKTLAAYEGRDILDPRPPSGRVRDATLDEVSRIRVPTLIIHGDHDFPLVQPLADTLIRRMPNARRLMFNDAGHGVHPVHPQAFNRALIEFFESVDRRRSP